MVPSKFNSSKPKLIVQGENKKQRGSQTLTIQF
jgi:hypothetical protein